MPIKGKVNARSYEDMISNMKVGDICHLHTDYLSIFRKAILININCPVVFEGEMEKYLKNQSVIIKRIGEGLTEDDFELDFVHCNNSELCFDPISLYYKLVADKDDYIIFTDFEITSDEDEDEDDLLNELLLTKEEEPTHLESLKSQLAEAKKKEDWIKAAELRDEIKLYEKGDKK